MRVLVTGAGGFVGRHLVARLTAQGDEVVVVPRQWFAAPDAEGGARGTAPGEWPGCDALVHLAGIIPRKNAADDAEIDRINVEGTRRIAAAAVDAGIPRVIFLSTASVLGAGGEHPLTESDPVDPKNSYARSKARAEDAFWQALGRGSVAGVVLRPTPIFGRGGHGPVALLSKLARLPVPLPLAMVGGARSIVSIDSVLDIIGLCLTRGSAGTFLLADDEPLRAGDIVEAVRQGLQRSPMLYPFPHRLLAMAAGMAGRAAQWEAMTRPFVVRTERIKRETGWQPGPGSRQRLREMSATGEL